MTLTGDPPRTADDPVPDVEVLFPEAHRRRRRRRLGWLVAALCIVAVVAVVAVVVVVDDAVGLVVPRRTLTVTTAGLGVLPGPVMRNQGTSSVYGPPGWRTLTLEPLTVM
jgi:peptidoglycan/LPS O-acetylase OafA/YrhL